MGYLSWHPSGRLLAFSTNKVTLFFHTISTNETRDVFDAHSGLGIYWIDSDRVVIPPAINLPDRNETWPAWSPDGRYLYYSSAPLLPMQQFFNIRYDLMRVGYDIEHDQWGEPTVMISAQDAGGSVCQPKVSPDGRFLLFCRFPFGSLPMYQHESELCVLDLTTGQWRPLKIKSDQADSWHCWSSNGRWIVFGSRRLDGLFARPFFSYMDEQGQFHKPFVLPQEDPAYYDTCLQTFNVPELVQGPVTVKESELARVVSKMKKVSAPTANSQQSSHQEQTEHYQEGDESGHPPVRQ
jgi:Tol biopolymer transport system component